MCLFKVEEEKGEEEEEEKKKKERKSYLINILGIFLQLSIQHGQSTNRILLICVSHSFRLKLKAKGKTRQSTM